MRFGFLTWGQIIVLFTLTLFSSLIPIPAMLGIYEGTNILAFQTVQLTAETGLSFTLMTRLIDFSFVFVGLLIIVYYLTHHVFRFVNGKNDIKKK